MRTIVAVTLAISVFFAGLIAVSQQAQEFDADANTTEATNTSYNTAERVWDGVGGVLSEGMVWFGVAAAVLVGCGALVVASRGGGR